MRAVKLFLIGLIVGLFTLLSVGFLYSYYNGDKIAAVGITYVNELLDAKVTVEEIHFSVIKHFPYATLDLTNVCALSKKGFKLNVTDSINSDTLLKTRHIYLKFNLLQILKNKFILSRIEVNKGFVYLLINNKSEDNFNIFKTSAEKSNSKFSLNLNKVELTDCQLYIINENKKLYLSSWISNTSLSGNFAENSFEIESSLKSKLIHLMIDKVSYCHNIPLAFSIKATSKNNNFSIKKGELTYANLPLSLSGNFKTGKSVQLNLQLKASELDINKLKNHLSVFLGFPTMLTNITGDLSVNASITGKLDKTSIPSIYSDFEWKKGLIELDIKGEKQTFNAIELHAIYSNGINKNAQSSSIKADIQNLAFQHSKVNGKVLLSNFADLKLESTFNSTIQLIDINKFIQSKDTIQFKEGELNCQGGFKGRLDSIAHHLSQTLWLKGDIKNASCNLFDKQYTINYTNGNFNFTDKLELNNIKTELNTMPLQFTGTIDGFRQTVFGEKTLLNIEGKTIWDWFDGSLFGSAKKSDKKETTNGISFPENISFKLDFEIKKLKISTFQANNVEGKVRYKPNIFILNELKFNSMNGSITANGVVAQQVNGDLSIKLQSQLNKLTISEIFHSFNNFGQKVLLPQHLKGSLTGSINFAAEWDKNLKVYDDRIVSDASFELNNGELIDFKPLEGLSKFIALSELKHIYFSTIKNQIFIKNKIITIPQMDITSSALNLQLSGTHNFQNQYDYHVKLALSEILFRKARDSKKEVSDNAEEDKDKGAKLYLTIKGDGENYKVKYDSKSSRKAFAETLINERKTIANLLKKEFSADTTKTTTTPPKKFTIDWEDAKPNETKEVIKKAPQKEVKKEKEKFKIEWEN